jgi:hypothetical protein
MQAKERGVGASQFLTSMRTADIEEDSSVGIVARLWAGSSGVEFPVGVRHFLFSKAFRSALGSAQLPIECAQGLFPWG